MSKKKDELEFADVRRALENATKLSAHIYDLLRSDRRLDGAKAVEVGLATALVSGRIARELGVPAKAMGVALVVVDDAAKVFEPVNAAASELGAALASGDAKRVQAAYEGVLSAQKAVGEVLRGMPPDDDCLLDAVKRADSLADKIIADATREAASGGEKGEA